MTSTVSASPVAAGTAGAPAGDPAPAAPHASVPYRDGPIVDAPAPADAAAVFRGTVTPVAADKPVSRGTPAVRVLRRRAVASGWATARNPGAARDLIAGDLVGAYGLVNSGTTVQSDVVGAASPLASSRPTGGGARHHRSETPAATSGSGLVDRTTHGARGPQGGMQSSSGGGGAASPLARATRIGLAAQPQLRFATGPVLRLLGMQGRRLERPG
ncbi:MAG: hypothetical protein ACXVH1_16490 [Solirubrobacteraceae bacterium]